MCIRDRRQSLPRSASFQLGNGRAGLAYIQPRTNRQIYNTWFRPTRLAGVKGKILSVQVAALGFQQWLEENAGPACREASQAVEGTGPGLFV